MRSIIAEKIALKNNPMAMLFSDTFPENGKTFKEGKFACVAAMMNLVVNKGVTAAFDRNTFGCPGGAAGLCLGNYYHMIPGGIEPFLSSGAGEGYPPGEFYLKTPEIAAEFVEELNIQSAPHDYIILKPLSDVDEATEQPFAVSFFVNPDQLSACVYLANYNGGGLDNVRIPFAAGCQSIALMAYNESQQKQPKAIVGMIDVTVRMMLDQHTLAFTMPISKFQEMENSAEESFLTRHVWGKIKEKRLN